MTDASEQLATAIASGRQADDAGKKASEVVAGRLPGLHDPSSSTTTGEVSPGANAVPQPAAALPKPPPALHTDRYSPGAAPPATALQPGGRHDQLATPARPERTTPEEQQP